MVSVYADRLDILRMYRLSGILALIRHRIEPVTRAPTPDRRSRGSGLTALIPSTIGWGYAGADSVTARVCVSIPTPGSRRMHLGLRAWNRNRTRPASRQPASVRVPASGKGGIARHDTNWLLVGPAGTESSPRPLAASRGGLYDGEISKAVSGNNRISTLTQAHYCWRTP